MELLHKLPFILGAAIAIIVGIFCNALGVRQQDTYLKMAISMALFYIIGVYMRSTIKKILDEVEIKRHEKEKIKQREMEEAERAASERLKESLNTKNLGTKLDLKVDDYGEDFSPLTVSEYIDSK